MNSHHIQDFMKLKIPDENHPGFFFDIEKEFGSDCGTLAGIVRFDHYINVHPDFID